MKNLIKIISILLLFVTFNARSQSCPVPEPLNKATTVGTYEGNYLIDSEIVPLKMIIALEKDQLTTRIAINGKDLKSAKTEICPSEDLHIRIDSNGRQYEFRGDPKGNKISGNVVIMNSRGESSSELFSVTKT